MLLSKQSCTQLIVRKAHVEVIFSKMYSECCKMEKVLLVEIVSRVVDITYRLTEFDPITFVNIFFIGTTFIACK